VPRAFWAATNGWRGMALPMPKSVILSRSGSTTTFSGFRSVCGMILCAASRPLAICAKIGSISLSEKNWFFSLRRSMIRRSVSPSRNCIV